MFDQLKQVLIKLFKADLHVDYWCKFLISVLNTCSKKAHFWTFLSNSDRIVSLLTEGAYRNKNNVIMLVINLQIYNPYTIVKQFVCIWFNVHISGHIRTVPACSTGTCMITIL